MYSTVNETHVVNWKAYPEYAGTVTRGNFVSSAMAIGVIGARNVAMIVSHLGIDVQDRKDTVSFGTVMGLVSKPGASINYQECVLFLSFWLHSFLIYIVDHLINFVI